MGVVDPEESAVGTHLLLTSHTYDFQFLLMNETHVLGTLLHFLLYDLNKR